MHHMKIRLSCNHTHYCASDTVRNMITKYVARAYNSTAFGFTLTIIIYRWIIIYVAFVSEKNCSFTLYSTQKSSQLVDSKATRM